MTVIVHGWDLALNHSAFVELHDGELADFWYVTDKAGSAAKHQNGIRLKLDDKVDRSIRGMKRLAWLEHYIDKTILMPRKPHYVGIEDYAVGAEQGAHYMGEIGGIARILCWFRGVNLRLHDPRSVKMWVAHNGNAKKDVIEEAVMERWGVDFKKYNQPSPKPTARVANPKQNTQTSEDLADAYAIAKLVWTEVQLRQGNVRLNTMHAKEIQVFNRVTKAYPVNLLDREWIVNEDGVDTPHGRPICPRCSSTKCCLAKRRKMIKK